MTFYETLSELMDRNNVSKKQLSEILQIGKNQFKYWETKGNIPNGETLIALSDYFKCSVDYILGRTNVPTINGNTQFNGENHNGIQATVNTGNLTVNENARSYADTDELVNLVKSLPIVERAKAVIYLNELKTKTSPDSGEEKKG